MWACAAKRKAGQDFALSGTLQADAPEAGSLDEVELFSFHPESLSFRMSKLLVFFTETRSFFFWQGNQAIMRRRILIR